MTTKQRVVDWKRVMSRLDSKTSTFKFHEATLVCINLFKYKPHSLHSFEKLRISPSNLYVRSVRIAASQNSRRRHIKQYVESGDET